MRIVYFFRWLGYFIYQYTSRFGISLGRLLLWAVCVVLGFGIIYWIGDAIGFFPLLFRENMLASPVQYFYLSAVTFVTLGFGDITPQCPQAQILVIIEAILAWIITVIAIPTLLNKSRRP